MEPAAAKKIIDEFCGPAAPCPINIPHTMLNVILETFARGPRARANPYGYDENLFHSAVVEIRRILEKDLYPRFKRHNTFEHFKAAHFRKFAQKNFVVGDQVNLVTGERAKEIEERKIADHALLAVTDEHAVDGEGQR